MQGDAPARRLLPVAGLDRRFYAWVLDRALAVTAYAGAVLAAWRLVDAGRPGLAGAVLAVTVLVVVAAFAVGEGLFGSTPGKAALGLRTVDVESGLPVGVGPALVRGTVLELAGLPTFGLGLAALALSALVDPEHRRRGWHDRISAAMVVDVRPPPPEPAPEPAPWRPVVNLTAARLVPGPPVSAPLPVPPPTPPTPPPPTPPPTPSAVPEGRAAVRRTPAPTRWCLCFDTGERVVVEGPCLIGRAPEAHEGEQVRHLVPLASRDLSLSKTHARFHLADGALVVADRGSTNGTVLIRQGVSRELSEGRPTTLLDGDRVRLGDRELTVRRES